MLLALLTHLVRKQWLEVLQTAVRKHGSPPKAKNNSDSQVEIDENDPISILQQTIDNNLDELDFSQLSIDSFPAYNGQQISKILPRLPILDISYNRFKEIPSGKLNFYNFVKSGTAFPFLVITFC